MVFRRRPCGRSEAHGPLSRRSSSPARFCIPSAPRFRARKAWRGRVARWMASVGLFLFLLGIGIGFMPFGRTIGKTIGAIPQTWLLAIFGAFLGFATTWGEPAVRILADQVEQASAGTIRRSVVLTAVCAGVAVAVAIGMLRITYDWPLFWIVAPGYTVAVALIWLSDRSFVAIAVDAGGVATGPLANTFLLALGFGVAAAVAGRDPLVHGLGLAALIALAPIISVMLLGFVVRLKSA